MSEQVGTGEKNCAPGIYLPRWLQRVSRNKKLLSNVQHSVRLNLESTVPMVRIRAVRWIAACSNVSTQRQRVGDA